MPALRIADACALRLLTPSIPSAVRELAVLLSGHRVTACSPSRAARARRACGLAAAVYPREILKLALHHNAAALIMAHNHPSGQAEASQADRHLTKAVQQALALIDVRMLDHLIVAGAEVVSMSQRGLI